MWYLLRFFSRVAFSLVENQSFIGRKPHLDAAGGTLTPRCGYLRLTWQRFQITGSPLSQDPHRSYRYIVQTTFSEFFFVKKKKNPV